jgi:hypothetical protein
MELNPNSPVVQKTRDQWHKLCALVMLKTGNDEMEIFTDDI